MFGVGRVCGFMYAGIIFNTRAVVGYVVVGCGLGDKHAFVVGLLLPTRIGEGVFVRGEWCPLPHFSGRFFSTHVMRGLLQVMSIFASFVRVLFLIPVWLWRAWLCAVWTER